MTKPGRRFEFGAPHISEGICYYWPSEKDYPLFLEKKEEIEGFILEKVRKHMDEFEVFTSIGHYPYLQKNEKCIIVHTGDDGRWFTVEDDIGSGMIYPHNLDSISDNIMAFNTASDILDFLDEKTEAPRILITDGMHLARYPLPEGFKLLPFNENLEGYSKKNLQRIFSVAKLGEITDIINKSDHQAILGTKGRIEIQDGLCFTSNFLRHDVPGATWVIKTLLSPYNHS